MLGPQLHLLLLGYRKPLLHPLREARYGGLQLHLLLLATRNLYYIHSERQDMVGSNCTYCFLLQETFTTSTQRGKIWWAPTAPTASCYKKPLLHPLREARYGGLQLHLLLLATRNLYYIHSERQDMVGSNCTYCFLLQEIFTTSTQRGKIWWAPTAPTASCYKKPLLHPLREA